MTLYQLGEDYLRQARTLKGMILSKRQSLSEASGIRVYELNSQITCLCEMEREMRLTGETLKSYYSDKSQGRIYHAQSRY